MKPIGSLICRWSPRRILESSGRAKALLLGATDDLVLDSQIVDTISLA